jgi:hypothetical protein
MTFHNRRSEEEGGVPELLTVLPSPQDAEKLRGIR